MPQGRFDGPGFYAALDRVRRTRGLTWKQVAEQSEVSAPTFTRLAQKRRPDVDSLAALVVWAGLRADDFVRCGVPAPAADTLAEVSVCLRRDGRLTDETATALERLIEVAYQVLAVREAEPTGE